MSTTYFTNSKQEIQIEKEPIGIGGTAKTYRIIGSSERQRVAKIFKNHNESLENKLKYMVQHRPKSKDEHAIDNTIIWPLDLLYDEQGSFAGYMMVEVADALSLMHFVSYRSPKLEKDTVWQKFLRSQGSSVKRLKLCYNIAQAIKALHDSGKYLLVGINPDNILISSNGTAVIIDLDEIQITQEDKLLFPQKAITDTYTPPEYYNKNEPLRKKSTWSDFSYAIIIYQILLGIHPFQAGHKTHSTISELVKAGLFANGKRKNEFNIIPKPHDAFYDLNPVIQENFKKTFDDGIKQPEKRTKLDTWIKTLLSLIQSSS